MHSKVSSDWLPSYIKATRPVLEILKIDGYFPDSPPNLHSTRGATWLGLPIGLRTVLPSVQITLNSYSAWKSKITFFFASIPPSHLNFG